MKLKFSRQVFEKSQLVRTHENRRTDKMKLTAAFSQFWRLRQVISLYPTILSSSLWSLHSSFLLPLTILHPLPPHFLPFPFIISSSVFLSSIYSTPLFPLSSFIYSSHLIISFKEPSTLNKKNATKTKVKCPPV